MKPLKEYFHVGDKPVKVVRPGLAVRADTKWKLLEGVGLTKTYAFEQRDERDEFVVRCLAVETYRGKQDVVWTIDGDYVEVLVRIPGVGVTEVVREFARALDDLREDLLLSFERGDRSEDVFIF